MKSPRRRYFWPRMTPVLSRASNYSLMVAERKSKSFASVACVARQDFSLGKRFSRRPLEVRWERSNPTG